MNNKGLTKTIFAVGLIVAIVLSTLLSYGITATQLAIGTTRIKGDTGARTKRRYWRHWSNWSDGCYRTSRTYWGTGATGATGAAGTQGPQGLQGLQDSLPQTMTAVG